MQNIGNITLNISFVIYLVQFVPQIIHNTRNKDAIDNISMLTQFGMLTVVLCNVVQAVGFDLNWQYLVIALIYLVGITIQQLQISFHKKRMPKVINLIFAMLFAIAILAMRSDSKLTFEIAGIISLLIHFLYWLPQIYKNYKQQTFIGYGDLFIILAWLGIICDLCSSFLLGWPIIVKLNIITMSLIISILVLQKIYYRRLIKK